MRHAILFLLMPFVVVCSGPPTKGSDPAPPALEVRSFEDFVDEFCGRWSKVVWGPGRESLYVEFFQRARGLPREAIEDHAFRVIADPTRHACWRVAAEVIGLGGRPDDALELVRIMETTNIFGQAPPADSPRSVFYENWADITHGLGFAAALQDDGRAVEDLMMKCAEPAFWLEQARVLRPAPPDVTAPVEASSPAEIRWIGLAMRRCIHALGNAGDPRTGEYLETARGGLPWHESFPLVYIADYDFALRKHRLIARFGLEQMLRLGHGPKL